MSAAAIPALTWADTDLKVNISDEELPTLEACRELSMSGGRAELLLYLREAGVKSLGERRKIAAAVEKTVATDVPTTCLQATVEVAAASAPAPAPAPVQAPAPAHALDAAKESALALASADSAEEFSAFLPRFALGSGQFGVVWLLVHPDGRKLVDKRVSLAGMTEEQKSDTHKEISLLRKLEFKYVVRYYHSYEDTPKEKKTGKEAPTLHILMEYGDGGTLDAKISEQKMHRKGLEATLVRRWIAQLIEALDHIHNLRVIHRDLKTANILLCGTKHGGVAKLADFGISRLMSSHTNFASTTVGTPYYLAPELIGGQGYDGRADIWSLGVICYELLALDRPFKGENIAMLAMAISRKHPSPLPVGTPPDLHNLTDRILKFKDKIGRPTAHQLLHEDPVRKWIAEWAAAESQPTNDAALPETPPPTPSSPATHLSVATTPTLAATAVLTAFPVLAATTATLALAQPPPPTPSAQAARDASSLSAALTGLFSPTAVSPTIPPGLKKVFSWRGGDAQEPLWHNVEQLVNHEVVGLCAGPQAAAALMSDGDVFTWMCGPDKLTWAEHKKPTSRLKATKLHAVQLAMSDADGDPFLLLVTRDGGVFEWLANKPEPRVVPGLPTPVGAVAISCGAEHSVLVSEDGRVFAWGRNEEGQLGLGTKFAERDRVDSPEPMPLHQGMAARGASCAVNTTFVLTQSGHGLSCGSNEHGQLAHEEGDAERVAILKRIGMPKDADGLLVQLACGDEHAVALTSDGRVLSWGRARAESGRLGRKPKHGLHKPACVSFAEADQHVCSISAGGTHTVALTDAGAMWVWGQPGRSCPIYKPVRVLGNMLGDAHFLCTCASSGTKDDRCYTLAVAIVPNPPDEADW